MRIELTTYAPCQTPAVTVRVRRSSLPDDPLLETMLSPHSHQVVDAPCSPIDPEHEQRAHTRRCVPVVSSGLEWEKLTARSKRTVQPAPPRIPPLQVQQHLMGIHSGGPALQAIHSAVQSFHESIHSTLLWNHTENTHKQIHHAPPLLFYSKHLEPVDHA